jgi:small GTP-binding protein
MIDESKTTRIKGKVCLLGDVAVGKTSLIRRFVFDTFEGKYISTIGAKVTKRSIEISYPEFNQTIDLTLLIWDIVGQHAERLPSTLTQYEHYVPPKNYFRNAKAAIIVCDITREDTFNDMRKWTTHLFELSGKVPLVFTGNKLDLLSETDFPVSKIFELAKENQGEGILTSARSGENVEKMFYTIGDMIVKEVMNWENETKSSSV